MKKNKAKILVVDDDKEVRDLITASLDSMEEMPQVETAGTGTLAEEKMKSFNPDLVILDLKLPGTHGMKLCQKIKKNKKTQKVKVLILTAYLTVGSRETVMECGADFCMEKPFGVLELAGIVKKLLGMDS